jgi:DNA-binding Lrp family transcriptional regulator
MVIAYVLMTVPAKRSGAVVEDLKKHPEVREAAAVYGDTDVLAKVEAVSLPELDRVIMENIQASNDVQSTRTLIVIERLAWTR